MLDNAKVSRHGCGGFQGDCRSNSLIFITLNIVFHTRSINLMIVLC